MCLDAKDDITKNYRVGYKVFRCDNSRFFRSPLQPYVFEPNTWVTDTSKGTLCLEFSNKRYPTGFHFFKNKKDAEMFARSFHNVVVKKIKVRNIVATGIQFFNGFYKDRPVGVAKDIFIIHNEAGETA